MRDAAHSPSQPRRHALARLRALLIVPTLAGCIVLPQTEIVYDPDCKMHTRQVTLQTAYIGGFQRCAGDGCVAMLAAAGFVTAASVVVSGSIAIVGNVLYWAERQGRCPRPAASASSGASNAVAPSTTVQR